MNKNNIKFIIKTIVIMMIVFIVISPFVLNRNYKIDEVSAFRSLNEIDPNCIMFDDEAIALAESATDTSLRKEALKAYNIVNDVREENNVDRLVWDENLENVSDVRSKEISESFSHTRPNGSAWYTVNSNIQGGENLAYGYNNAEDTVNAWLNSPTHKENILYDDFTKMAISIYENDGTYYWSQEYGY